MPKINISAADRNFSRCIREANDWTCEYSGKQFERGSQGLHCSHLFGRRAYAVRFDPSNAFAHSFWAHQHLGANPVEFADWAEERLGAGMIQILRERKEDIGLAKQIKKSLPDVAKHYKQELERIMGLRSQGYVGKIEVFGYV